MPDNGYVSPPKMKKNYRDSRFNALQQRLLNNIEQKLLEVYSRITCYCLLFLYPPSRAPKIKLKQNYQGVTKGRKRVIVGPPPAAKKKGWRRSFPEQALEVFRPESDDYELRVVKTGIEVWLGPERVWGLKAFPSEGES